MPAGRVLVPAFLSTLLAGSILLAASPSAAATTRIFDKAHKCQMDVPASWKAGGMTYWFKSPDRSANAMIMVSVSISSMAKARERAERLQKAGKVKIIEDDAHRVTYAETGGGLDRDWNVFANGGSFLCYAMLGFKPPATDAVVKTIAQSVAAAP